MAAYFLLTGLGFGVGAVAHQIHDTREGMSSAWESVAFSLVGLSMVALQWQQLVLSRWHRVGSLMLCIVVMIPTSVFQSLIIVGAYVLVTLVGMMGYFAWFQRDWAASFGCLLYVGGYYFKLFLPGFVAILDIKRIVGRIVHSQTQRHLITTPSFMYLSLLVWWYNSLEGIHISSRTETTTKT